MTFIWWHSNWFLIFLNFASMKYTIRTCNPTVKFSKFTLNIKIYYEFERFLSKLVWRKILFKTSEQTRNTRWLFVLWPVWVLLALIIRLALLVASFNTPLNNTFYITSSILLSLYLNMISFFLLILILFFLFVPNVTKERKKSLN